MAGAELPDTAKEGPLLAEELLALEAGRDATLEDEAGREEDAPEEAGVGSEEGGGGVIGAEEAGLDDAGAEEEFSEEAATGFHRAVRVTSAAGMVKRAPGARFLPFQLASHPSKVYPVRWGALPSTV